MALPYKLVQDVRTSSATKGYWMAKSVQMSTINLNDVARQVEENCSLKKSDVKACIEEMIDVLKKNLQNGICVHLDGIGRFRLGVKGTYAKTTKLFNVANNITGLHVNFMPDRKIVKGTTTVELDDGTIVTKKTRTAVVELTDGTELKMIQ